MSMIRHIGSARITEIIISTFEPIANKKILDVGCGEGNLLRALIRYGTIPIGIDPNENMIEHARKTAPRATCICTKADSLPFANQSFSGAVFLNSLHHIAKNDIQKSLLEVLRCVQKNQKILVLEPLTKGGYFEVTKPIHDETRVRLSALDELNKFLDLGIALREQCFEFDSWDRVPDIETLIARAIRVSEARYAAVEENLNEIRKLFKRHVQSRNGAHGLDQPMIAIVISSVC